MSQEDLENKKGEEKNLQNNSNNELKNFQSSTENFTITANEDGSNFVIENANNFPDSASENSNTDSKDNEVLGENSTNEIDSQKNEKEDEISNVVNEKLEKIMQTEKKKNKRRFGFIAFLTIILILGCAALLYYLFKKNPETETVQPDTGTYNILINGNENGIITTNLSSAKPNTIIQVNTESNLFYSLSKLYYITENDNTQILITNNSFVMPASNVTIYADFEELVYDTKQKSMATISYNIEDETSTVKIKPKTNKVLVSIENVDTGEVLYYNNKNMNSQYIFYLLNMTEEKFIPDLELQDYINSYFFNLTLPTGKEDDITTYLNNLDLSNLINSINNSEDFILKLNALKNQEFEFSFPYNEGQHFLVKFEDLESVYYIKENNFEAQIYPENKFALLTHYEGSETDLTLPETIKEIELVGINNSFDILTGSSGINSVFPKDLNIIKIPETFNRLSYGSLINLPSLIYVELPENLSYIDEYSVSTNNSKTIFKFNSTFPPIINNLAFETLKDVFVVAPGENIDLYSSMEVFQEKNYKIVEDDKICMVDLGLYLLDNETKTANLLYYLDNNASNLELPETIRFSEDNYTLNKITSYAFQYLKNLKTLILPNSITEIENYAFDGCSGLEVNIPSAIVTIGESAYFQTTISGLDENGNLVFPATLSSIGSNAFASCNNLKSVSFVNCNKLTKLSSGLFKDCKNLTSVELSEHITELNGGVFSNCTELISINISDSVVSIGSSAFQNCEKLKIEEFGEQITYIGQYSFENTAIENLVINCTSVEIEISAFSNCVNLQTVTINGYLNTPKSNLFINCDSLEYVIFTNPQPSKISQYSFIYQAGGNFVVYIADEYYDKYKDDLTTWFYGLPSVNIPVKKLTEKNNEQ